MRQQRVGYNALLQIAKKLNKAYNDECNCKFRRRRKRAIDQVYKEKNSIKSKIL